MSWFGRFARSLLEDFIEIEVRNLAAVGTGQSIATADNHAWFVGVVGISDPRYVVAVLIDEGGSGGAVAAPVARQIMQYLQGEELTPITAGASAQ